MTATNSVLIVDDEPSVRDLMARWAVSLGMNPHTASDANEALDTLSSTHCDLAVIDVMMPGRDGLWLASQMEREYPQTAVVIATAFASSLADRERPALIADFLIKPFQRDRFALAVDRGRRWRKEALDEIHWHRQLSIEMGDRTDQICAEVHSRAAHDGSEVEALVKLMTSRVPQTLAHSERVARYSVSVARELNMAAEATAILEVAARFHDIGKLAVPDALLSKPSPLTPGEMAIMRLHVDVGSRILSGSPTLGTAAPIVFASHEWFGGGGYPRQLAGIDVPLGSRIIGVADAFDAMTQDRAYRGRLDTSDAIEELLRCSPSQFDPEVVDAFLAVRARH